MYILSRININISLYGNRMENTIVFDVNNVVVDTKEQPDVVIKKNKVVKKRKSYMVSDKEFTIPMFFEAGFLLKNNYCFTVF